MEERAEQLDLLDKDQETVIPASRICSKCEIEKPLTAEYFHRGKAYKHGLRSDCKECRNNYLKQHYQENIVQIKKREKRHYEENKERLRDYGKKQSKKYRERNGKQIRQNKKIYYEQNKEKELNRGRQWRKANPVKNRRIAQRRRSRKAMLPATLTVEDYAETLATFNNACAYCGVTDDQLSTSLQQEHVIPLSKGGGYTKENIIPACASCNLSKGTRNMETWYKDQEAFTAQRLKMIKDFQALHTN